VDLIKHELQIPDVIIMITVVLYVTTFQFGGAIKGGYLHKHD